MRLKQKKDYKFKYLTITKCFENVVPKVIPFIFILDQSQGLRISVPNLLVED